MKPTKLRPDLPSLPSKMKTLPIDDRGYPVPSFVQYLDGQPDFRVADSRFKEDAIIKNLCYVCGKPFTLPQHVYVIGPMCVVNRTTGEPPVHIECAHFSAKGCPFLARPHATRREKGLPEGHKIDEAAIKRNPGVTALYATQERKIYRRSMYVGDFLIFLGEPKYVKWYAQGREATYAQVAKAMHDGYGALLDSAKTDGMEALAELRQVTHRALPTMPRIKSGEDAEAHDWIVRMGVMLWEATKTLPEARA